MAYGNVGIETESYKFFHHFAIIFHSLFIFLAILFIVKFLSIAYPAVANLVQLEISVRC